ncbi:MAG: hypothetical protein IKU34_04360 [Clostridia bacterium]|nr:hypothetical protein [Clostridia bacterium]
MSKKLHRATKAIGRGGMYGATAAIFPEGNPISRKKNRFLSIFSYARRARLEIEEGWSWRGNGSPVHQPVKKPFLTGKPRFFRSGVSLCRFDALQ